MDKIRTCIICNSKNKKENMLRIFSKNGKAYVDKEQKENIRGAYICNTCLKKKDDSIKKIYKSYKNNLTVDLVKDIINELEEI